MYFAHYSKLFYFFMIFTTDSSILFKLRHTVPAQASEEWMGNPLTDSRKKPRKNKVPGGMP